MRLLRHLLRWALEKKLPAYKQQKEIQPEWRIKWRGKRYEITGIDPDYQNKDLTKVTAQVIIRCVLQAEKKY